MLCTSQSSDQLKTAAVFGSFSFPEALSVTLSVTFPIRSFILAQTEKTCKCFCMSFRHFVNCVNFNPAFLCSLFILFPDFHLYRLLLPPVFLFCILCFSFPRNSFRPQSAVSTGFSLSFAVSASYFSRSSFQDAYAASVR